MSSDTIHSTEQEMNDEQKLLWDTLFKRLDKIEDKQDSFAAFKWQIIGGAAATSFIFGIFGALIGMAI